MLGTIAILVLIASIIVLFASELSSFIKKVIANKKVQLLFPLLFFSWLFLFFAKQIVYLSVVIRVFLYSLVLYLSKIFPFDGGDLISERILVLMLFSIFPILVAQLVDNYLHFSFKLKNIAHSLSIFIFAVITILYVISL
ncbi:MAG: hypothetical protein A3E88_06290 [Legionellales bacterium RIFCSPHIGHO2_12_FULL_35_11]|nr:MAG: hypothetical protein A3E88_06290 [Legionellales bacterium RIFCSPHIGHO2_12_FULL_35_11]